MQNLSTPREVDVQAGQPRSNNKATDYNPWRGNTISSSNSSTSSAKNTSSGVVAIVVVIVAVVVVLVVVILSIMVKVVVRVKGKENCNGNGSRPDVERLQAAWANQ